MIIEQMVDIPADRKLTIEVPREVPAGRVVLTFTTESGERGTSAVIEAIPEASRGNSSDEAFRHAIRNLQGAWKDNPWENCIEDIRAMREESGEAVKDCTYWHTAPLVELDAEIERRRGRPVTDADELKLFRGILRAQGAWKNNPWENCIEDIRAMREEWDHRDPWNSDPAKRHRD